MKGGKQPHGFTVIEVMIFLAVSGAIFISVITLMSGSQNKTEFNTAITEFTSQLQSIVGNVANGYYLSQQNFTCTPNPTGNPTSPTMAYFISGGSGTPRGTSLGCTFIGEVIQFHFASDAANAGYIVYPVVGNQYNPPTSTPGPSNLNVTDLTQAAPVALYDTTDDPVKASIIDSEIDTIQEFTYGITVHPSGMGWADSSITTIPANDTCSINNVNLVCTGAIGFFTTFNGSQSVQVIPIPGSTLAQDYPIVVNEINSLQNGTGNNITGVYGSFNTVSNPDGGVEICLDSGTDSESGLITIGGVNSPTAVTLQKYSQKGCV
jgi:hypothetical protein